jgi:hypothetical protein
MDRRGDDHHVRREVAGLAFAGIGILHRADGVVNPAGLAEPTTMQLGRSSAIGNSPSAAHIP